MKSLVVLVLLAVPALADHHPYAVSPGRAPEPAPVIDHGYLGGGAGLAIDHFFNSFLALEGAIRVSDLPLWVRASGAAGSAFDFQGGLDAGGESIRLRIALDAYRYRRTSDVDGLADASHGGAGLSIALVHRM